MNLKKLKYFSFSPPRAFLKKYCACFRKIRGSQNIQFKVFRFSVTETHEDVAAIRESKRTVSSEHLLARYGGARSSIFNVLLSRT